MDAGTNDQYVLACTEAVHDLYCTLYEVFCALWVKRDPRDVMVFPIIFAEFKERVHRRYPIFLNFLASDAVLILLVLDNAYVFYHIVV